MESVLESCGLKAESVADPGSGAFLTHVSGIGDQRWVKNQDHIPGLKFFDTDADPGSSYLLALDPGWKKIRIRDKHPESANIYFKFSTYCQVSLYTVPVFICIRFRFKATKSISVLDTAVF
jgi:hypothetical protein